MNMQKHVREIRFIVDVHKILFALNMYFGKIIYGTRIQMNLPVLEYIVIGILN